MCIRDSTDTQERASAEDITKEISDPDFSIETCMEGIHYDAEREDVALTEIKGEDGGDYHPCLLYTSYPENLDGYDTVYLGFPKMQYCL